MWTCRSVRHPAPTPGRLHRRPAWCRAGSARRCARPPCCARPHPRRAPLPAGRWYARARRRRPARQVAGSHGVDCRRQRGWQRRPPASARRCWWSGRARPRSRRSVWPAWTTCSAAVSSGSICSDIGHHVRLPYDPAGRSPAGMDAYGESCGRRNSVGQAGRKLFDHVHASVPPCMAAQCAVRGDTGIRRMTGRKPRQMAGCRDATRLPIWASKGRLPCRLMH